jgi:peptidoglycan/LPS O-acetylase OafA/YrhL
MGTFRLLLAISVLISHTQRTYFGLNFGVVAVISFLMLSGFVMTILIEKHYRAISLVPAFYLDRAMRLQPQYLFYLLLFTLYFFTIATPQPWIKSIDLESFFLNVAIAPANFYMLPFMSDQVINPPAWSLGLEVCFYLTIPFLLIYRLRKVAFGLSLVFFLAAYAGYVNTDWFGYRLLPGTLFMFLMGSLLYKPGKVDTYLFWGVWLAAVVGFGYTIMHPQTWLGWNREVLLGLCVAAPCIKVLRAIPSNKLDHLLGDISYGVFLNHFLVIWIAREFDVITPTTFELCLMIAVSIACAWVTFHAIELPAIKLRKKLRRKTAAVNLETNPLANHP